MLYERYRSHEERTLGEAGNSVVIEEFMAGFEVSFIVLTDGRNIVRFPICQDYKNLSDSGKGPNTGGMGAHFPLPFSTKICCQNLRKKLSVQFCAG